MNLAVLIADPSYSFRTRLHATFTKTGDIITVQEMRTGEELLKGLSSHDWDLVVVNQSFITDFSLFSQEHFIVIDEKWNIEAFYDAYSYGAHGYVSKDAPPEVFHMAISLPQGAFLIEPGMTMKVIEHLSYKGRFIIRNELLTPREQEISYLLRKNLSRRVIAQKLCISEATLKTHIRNMTRKRI